MKAQFTKVTLNQTTRWYDGFIGRMRCAIGDHALTCDAERQVPYDMDAMLRDGTDYFKKYIRLHCTRPGCNATYPKED